MFGKKKDKIKKDKYSDLQCIVIPDVFYGGQDPYIYHSHIEENNAVKGSVLNDEKLKKQKKISNTPTNQNNKTSKKRIWIFGSIFLLLAIGLISWYYINDYNKAKAKLLAENTKSTPPVVIVKNDNPPPEKIPTTTVIIATSTIKLATSTPSLQNVFLEFSPILTLDTADVDADKLTDLEEEVFDTDSGKWDSDDDKYYDGQEVYNLYNPKGLAPVKLIDSGLIVEYKNPYSGYRIYYPIVWQRGSVDIQEKQVLFSASNGDYIEVRVFPKEVGQTFINWFSRYAEGQNYTDLSNFKNRFAENAMIRKDSLVAYFEDNNYIFTIIYHTKDRGPIFYRHIMQMMYQSFRMSKTNTILPEQVIYPSVENASSTNVLDNSSTINIVLPIVDTGDTTNNTSTNTTSNN